MSSVNSLRAHLLEELSDLLSAEQQLTDALPKMAKAATTQTLRKALGKHLKETREHATRLQDAMKLLGEVPGRKTCEAMAGLLEEGDAMMNSTPEGALRDAVMITAAQKVEHYEIASYGTVRTYALVLGERKVAKLLAKTLDEEKAADKKLTGIAEKSVNKAAAREWHEQRAEDGMLAKSAAWVGGKVGAAVRDVPQLVGRAAATLGVGDSDGRARGGAKKTRAARAARSADAAASETPGEREQPSKKKPAARKTTRAAKR